MRNLRYNPEKKMIELLDTVLDRIKNPVRCMDVAVPFNSLVWRSLDDAVMPVIKIMNDRNISHVPVLKDRRVVGDFSDNCIFPFLLGDQNCQIDGKNEIPGFAEIHKAGESSVGMF